MGEDDDCEDDDYYCYWCGRVIGPYQDLCWECEEDWEEECADGW